MAKTTKSKTQTNEPAVTADVPETVETETVETPETDGRPEAAAASEGDTSDADASGDARAAAKRDMPVAPAAAAPRMTLVPMNSGQTEASPHAKQLLLEACERFGISPAAEERPRELLAWNYYPARPLEDVPAAVVLVTAGGVKLKHFADPAYPMDPETEETLRRWLKAWARDAKDPQIIVPAELPDDLTLPHPAVTGLSEDRSHRYARGYLREGGKKEAAKRRAARG